MKRARLDEAERVLYSRRVVKNTQRNLLGLLASLLLMQAEEGRTVR